MKIVNVLTVKSYTKKTVKKVETCSKKGPFQTKNRLQVLCKGLCINAHLMIERIRRLLVV